MSFRELFQQNADVTITSSFRLESTMYEFGERLRANLPYWYVSGGRVYYHVPTVYETKEIKKN